MRSSTKPDPPPTASTNGTTASDTASATKTTAMPTDKEKRDKETAADKLREKGSSRNLSATPSDRGSITPLQTSVSTPNGKANGNASSNGTRQSGIATPAPDSSTSSSTPVPTSAAKPSRKSSSKAVKREVVLFNHLPSATEEAIKSFEVIPNCQYGSKNMGNTDGDVLDCDCKPEWEKSQNNACGEDGDCINRATKCECVVGTSACGDECQNQRFQRKQYADVDVIKTEKKGYGLRARQDLQANDFIYEYIGDVINEATFRRRMIKYDKGGIKHFYFMSLTRSEFVDATVKGNLGRFCNHSCNPNCYVDKWVVGNKLRMGIFALCDIQAGEELVFNYNVDRYGAEPQVCYCGESNCVGVIGGKTQTERATKLSTAVVEALGIDDGENWDTAVAKKPRKKKSVSDDEDPYVEGLEAKNLTDDSVRKVMAVLMQCKEKWIAVKLLDRIKACNEERILHIVVRMHAYIIMKSVLVTFANDDLVVLQVLHVLDKLPRITNNKIQASNITQTIQGFISSSNSEVADAADNLIKSWAKLKSGYRITKRQANAVSYEQDGVFYDERNRHNDASNNGSTADKEKKPPSPVIDAPKGPKNNTPQRNPLMQQTRRRMPFHGAGVNAIALSQQPQQQQQQLHFQQQQPQQRQDQHVDLLPEGWHVAKDTHGNNYYYNAAGQTTWERPQIPRPISESTKTVNKAAQVQEMYKNLIEQVLREPPKRHESPAVSTPQQAEQPLSVTIEPRGSAHSNSNSGKLDWWTSLSIEKQKKHYENTIAGHVKTIAESYRHKLPRDELKRFSKDICKKIVDSDYKRGRVNDPRAPLPSRAIKNLKEYVCDFFKKAVVKYQARKRSSPPDLQQNGQDHHPPAPNSSASTLGSAPASLSATSAAHTEDTPFSAPSSPGSDGKNKRKRDGDGDGDGEPGMAFYEGPETASSKRLKDEIETDADVEARAEAAIVPCPPPPPTEPTQAMKDQQMFREQEEALVRENEEAQRDEDAALANEQTYK
ncbi:Histone-lysine N-methyltransferase H3 lysine-36 specific [Ceratocystis platani]|uniref:Histone-lysine N-methyltransferase, H3 lysine-36 specific n=1 Tax=Ceratocystis fimbriata f. sp. platani TaxID=88771 RepID=A0A0F8BRF6_CERFI|nr:Histone-lysine N-methyltransferase H3 lysine-36 specific [Ceratocystis platani]